MSRIAPLALALLCSAAPVWGADKSGQPRDQVSFRVESTRDVPNDWVAASLGVDEEGNDVAALAARVNRRMAEALALAKQQEELQVSSGAYQTQPVYDRNKIVRWRASQDMIVEGANVEQLTELVGRLQAQCLLLRGVSFSVVPETRKRVEDELIVDALNSFRERAGLIARGLGRRGWNLISLAVGESGMPVPLVQGATMRMEAAEAVVAPAFESGRSTLRMEVNATVELD